ncbi:sulfatase-like hydrolase/transferase [Marivita sp.]|uniref:sulfatase-like hydrolase/transferase n=1 Tax=Marivita sp. TaxID=2003365 RepID=UPI003F6AD1D1
MTGRVAQLTLATLVLHLVLVQPNHPAAMGWNALLLFPLELPIILLVLVALSPGRWTQWVRAALVGALLVIALLKTADFAMFTALTRGFNPVADLPLIEAGLRLATGAVGPFLTAVGVVAALLALALVGLALWWASGVWAQVKLTQTPRRIAMVAAVFVGGVATAEIGHAMGRWALPTAVPGAAFTARVAVERTLMVRDTLADLRAFSEATAQDRFADRTGLLDAIDRDVLVIFVESYGRTSLDTPLFANTHRATLATSETRLEALGLSMRSGILASPTRGGQSWLSHATFANGLWVADQTSYGAVLASGRKTLFHIAEAEGFHTAAVMPQITLDWPEANFMGFETVLAAKDLGYEGLPFNWVTMPDQFTFASMDRLLRTKPDDRPLFIQMALGSSHAPWLPVPELVDWNTIGNGEIFNPMAEAGDPPDVVWRDRDRVREQYRLAIDYALQVVFDYVARRADDPPLVFVVGDHQAASFVALDERPDVPIHVIGPEYLVERAADWGWTKGLLPHDTATPRPMNEMRNLILDAYSAPPLKDSNS